MAAYKSQYLEEISEFGIDFMEEEELKLSYQLPDGTPVYTDNPELENQFDKNATWTEEDFTEIKAWLDELQHAIDEFRSAFNNQEVGQPKYRRLVKELNEVRDYHKLLRDEVITRVCFCNRGKLDWPEVDYNNPEWTRREELATNQYIERREKL